MGDVVAGNLRLSASDRLLPQVKRADVVRLAGDRLRVERQLNPPLDLATDLRSLSTLTKGKLNTVFRVHQQLYGQAHG